MDMVKPLQLKLLAILKQKITVNFPFYLNYVLQDIPHQVKKEKVPHLVIGLHGLIKLIIIHELAQ